MFNLKPQIDVPLSLGQILSNDAMAAPVITLEGDEKFENIDSKPQSIEWEEDRERMKVTTKLPPKLLELLGGKWINSEHETEEPCLETAASMTSPSALEKMEKNVEMAKSRCLRKLIVPRPRLIPLVYELSTIWPKSSIQLSGMFVYPKEGGYMGWHTNSDSPCTRVYISHVKDGGKSFFRYRLDGEYVTSWDKAGWNMRCFEVTKENPMWHCVYAEEDRLSVGFRINRNLL